MKRTNTLLIVFAIIVILVAGFIFSNSVQSSEDSHERSEPISEQIHEMVAPKSADENLYEWESFIRKSAHGLEFAILGICVSVFVLILFRKKRRLHICAALLCVLAVAVLDEFIQSFTGRTSSVRDVLLDFIGGCCGFVITVLVYMLITFIKSKKFRTNNRGQ